MRSLLVLMCSFALAAGAQARESAPVMTDHGAELPFDPYKHDTQLTTGRMEGFRRLFVDPNTFPDTIVPATEGAEGAKGDLPIHNDTSTWVHVAIGDTRIGQVRPYDTAVIHDVKPGTYTIQFTMPHGYTWTEPSVTTPK
jgi:hypothetical protein